MKLNLYLLFCIVTLYSCSKKEILSEDAGDLNPNEREITTEKNASDSSNRLARMSTRPDILPSNKVEKPLKNKSGDLPNSPDGSITMFSTTSYNCGASLYDSYYGSGYYTYPDYFLDLTSTPIGSTISVALTSYDVPNRFTIYDINGNFIESSGWMG